MMYVTDDGREAPWLGLGTPVTEAQDTETALVLAGLAWGVEQVPVMHRGRPVPSGHKINIRSDTGEPLGVVGPRTQTVQNRQLANLLDQLVEEGARVETAGALRGGARVWMLARLPEEYRLAGDPTECYLLVSNHHDGGGAVRAAVAPVRVICENTLNLALKAAVRSWGCSHTGDLGSKLGEARRSLMLARRYMEQLATASEQLRSVRMAPSEWRALVERLVPVQGRSELAVQRQRERQDDILGRMMSPDLSEHRWTRWGAANAVADWVDHAAPVQMRQGWRETRMESVVDGHELVDKAVGLLIA